MHRYNETSSSVYKICPVQAFALQQLKRNCCNTIGRESRGNVFLPRDCYVTAVLTSSYGPVSSLCSIETSEWTGLAFGGLCPASSYSCASVDKISTDIARRAVRLL